MKRRNSTLDVIKGIAAIMVVFIHVQFPGIIGRVVNNLAAFAVPLFFMVSGYFSSNVKKEKISRSIKHIVALILFAYTINLVRIFFQKNFNIGNTILYLKEITTDKMHIIRFFLINETYISGVAWFLFALLYCYVVYYLFIRLITE